MNLENVIELNHPLIEHKLAILRDEKTGTKEFRELVKELSVPLCYRAMEDAQLEEVDKIPQREHSTLVTNTDGEPYTEEYMANMQPE